jgi:hypothetical protein
MAGSTIIKGSARRSLVKNAALSLTGSGGTVFGVFDTGHYARLAGLISVIGSATVRYQMGVNSGAYQVSSSFVVGSGGGSFDMLNFGHVAELSLSQASSQAGAVVLIYGEPIR